MEEIVAALMLEDMEDILVTSTMDAEV